MAVTHDPTMIISRAMLYELRSTISFMNSQIETLAHAAFSEDVNGWLEKCDAYNAGKRALLKIDAIDMAATNRQQRKR